MFDCGSNGLRAHKATIEPEKPFRQQIAGLYTVNIPRDDKMTPQHGRKRVVVVGRRSDRQYIVIRPYENKKIKKSTQTMNNSSIFIAPARDSICILLYFWIQYRIIKYILHVILSRDCVIPNHVILAHIRCNRTDNNMFFTFFKSTWFPNLL